MVWNQYLADGVPAAKDHLLAVEVDMSWQPAITACDDSANGKESGQHSCGEILGSLEVSGAGKVCPAMYQAG